MRLYKENPSAAILVVFDMLNKQMKESVEQEIKSLRTEMTQSVKAQVPDLERVLQSITGNDGEDSDPEEVAQILLAMPEFVLMTKGKDGKSISISDVISNLKEDGHFISLLKGEQGLPGKDGESIIGPQGPQGKAGESIKGDKGDDGSPDTAKEVVAKINSIPGGIKQYAIEGLETLIAELRSKVRGMKKSPHATQKHGGGDTFLAGTAITITTNADGTKTISSTASSTVYTETPSGTINGSNDTFTTAHSITSIYSFAINGQFIHPSEYSVAGSTITFVTAPDATLSGLPFTIIYS